MPTLDLRRGKTITEWQESYVWLVTDDGLQVPFADNAGQRELDRRINESAARAAEEHRPPRDLVIKPRRDGFTSKLTCGRLLVRACTEENLRLLYMGPNESDTIKTFADSVLRSYELLRPEVRPSRRNARNLSSLDLIETRSSILTKAASTPGAVRGGGYAEGLWDEVPRVQEVLSAAEQERLWSAVEPAFRYGAFRWLFTPDGTNDIAYEKWQESRRGANDWTRIFISHWMSDQCLIPNLTAAQVEEIQDTLTEEERFLLDRNGIRGAERFMRIAWRRQKMREHPKLFLQEYPEDEVSCWISPGKMFFEIEDIQRQERERRQPIKEGRWAPKYNGQLVYFVPPNPEHDYIAVTDYGVGHGTGDPSMTLIYDFDTQEVVAGIHTRDFQVVQFTEVTIALCREYGFDDNDPLWAPENNSPGRGGVSHAQTVLEYDNIYQHVDLTGVRVKIAHELGWTTTPGNRGRMLEDLYRSLRVGDLRVNFMPALVDLRAFKLRPQTGNKNSDIRYEAEKNAHDEGVICLAILDQVRRSGCVRPQVH